MRARGRSARSRCRSPAMDGVRTPGRCPASMACSRCLANLLVEADGSTSKVASAGPLSQTLSPSVGEHRQLVARDRRAGQALEQAAAAGRARPGMCIVPRRTPSDLLDAGVELVPGDGVGPTDLERAPAAPGWSTAWAKNCRDVLDPDRLQALVARSDDRRQRRQPHLADEHRQHAAVLAEDEARPEDDVLEPATRRPPAPSPTWRGSRGRARGSARSCRARSSARTARRRPPRGADQERCRAFHHHALEVGRRALDDRDEVDDRLAAVDRTPQALRVGHVAFGELAAPGCELRAARARGRARARRARARAARGRPSARRTRSRR